MDSPLLIGISSLGQPRMGSIYDETGTPESGYEEHGPYHCEDCIHKTASDEPFCIHPKVIADSRLQSRLVLLNHRPVVKIDLKCGCCKFVNQPLEDKDDSHGETSDK